MAAFQQAQVAFAFLDSLHLLVPYRRQPTSGYAAPPL